MVSYLFCPFWLLMNTKDILLDGRAIIYRLSPQKSSLNSFMTSSVSASYQPSWIEDMVKNGWSAVLFTLKLKQSHLTSSSNCHFNKALFPLARLPSSPPKCYHFPLYYTVQSFWGKKVLPPELSLSLFKKLAYSFPSAMYQGKKGLS